MKRILLIEDDKDLNMGLTYDLEEEQYEVYPAFTLGEGMLLLEEKEVDLILLDGNLPDGDGFDFCKAVKQERDIPVIFLTARDMEQDEMKGFDCGADDYITKPFRMPILHRRVEAALRKSMPKKEELVYEDEWLKIDFGAMTAQAGGGPLVLTPTEFRILRLLIANAGRVLTKTLLLEKIWDNQGNFVDAHAVAVNMNRLRKKLNPDDWEYIRTLYGMGYQWKGRA